jgi:2-polyprenyl-3-methyl-5-hydroxy-6-metoxy-1,4-benzoquinol methylase
VVKFSRVAPVPTTADRALESKGTSNSRALYALVREIVARAGRVTTVVDLGCGTGTLHGELRGLFHRYVGVDVVRHSGFPEAADAHFVELSLDDASPSLPVTGADVVCCIETIEHLENPRALARVVSRCARPGALIVITTPNQLSLLSKLCLLVNDEFVQFQERPGLYPAHLTALLEVDLRRIAREAGWTETDVHYTAEGRMPFTGRHWPRWLCSRQGRRGRAFSDNVVLSARNGTARSGMGRDGLERTGMGRDGIGRDGTAR